MEDKKTTSTYAIARGLRISPFRARLVIDLIRSKSVSEAKRILENTNKKASRLALNVLNSAVANAKENFKLDENKLFVKEARVDMGTTYKRVKFDSRGHIGRKSHQTSHILIVVEER